MNLLERFSCIPFCFLLLCACNNSTEEKNDDASKLTGKELFSLLDSSKTNIDFQNALTEGLNTNILMYEYFYNGGGIAAGDFNSDGLIDLYFTSNMRNNKLYINKSNMKFEHVTLLCSAPGRFGPWKTGVNAVDINGDVKLDI